MRSSWSGISGFETFRGSVPYRGSRLERSVAVEEPRFATPTASAAPAMAAIGAEGVIGRLIVRLGTRDMAMGKGLARSRSADVALRHSRHAAPPMSLAG